MIKSILYGACGILAAVTLVFMAGDTALAYEITVLNHSFESPDATEGDDTPPPIVFWEASGGGVYDPTEGEIIPYDGSQVGWLNGSESTLTYMYQDTVAIQVGLTYTLQVYVQKRDHPAIDWPVFRVQLRTDDQVEYDQFLESVTVGDPGFVWTAATVSYTGIPADAGKTLRIYFDSNDIQATFDMVSLTAVPIPSAVWLLGSGLVGIVGIRRKLRK